MPTDTTTGASRPHALRLGGATDSRVFSPGPGVLPAFFAAAWHERIQASAARTLPFIPSAVHWISDGVPGGETT